MIDIVNHFFFVFLFIRMDKFNHNFFQLEPITFFEVFSAYCSFAAAAI